MAVDPLPPEPQAVPNKASAATATSAGRRRARRVGGNSSDCSPTKAERYEQQASERHERCGQEALDEERFTGLR